MEAIILYGMTKIHQIRNHFLGKVPEVQPFISYLITRFGVSHCSSNCQQPNSNFIQVMFILY